MRARVAASSQRLQIATSACRSSADSGFGGIWLPGLLACGSRIQAARCSGVFGSVPAPSVLRVARCVRSGATWPCGVGAPDGVASGASGPHEDVTAASRSAASGGSRAGCRMASSQPSKSSIRFGDDVEGHVRVLQPAELRALAAEDARPIGLHPDRRRVARNQIALALKVRHPETVDDVARRDLQDDGPVRGNVESRSRSATRRLGTASSYSISHHH